MSVELFSPGTYPYITPTAPADHRTGVSAADTSDPADDTGAIDTTGYNSIHFYVVPVGGLTPSISALTVRLLFWDSVNSVWMHDDRDVTPSNLTNPVLSASSGGRKVFLRVITLTLGGTATSITIRYTLS